MNGPKEQHYFPKTFLEGFTNESSKLHLLDKDSGKISEPRKPTSVARKTHLYTITDGVNKNYTVENTFARYEERLLPLLRQIQRRGFSQLTDDEMVNIFHYVIHLYCRTPLFVNVTENVRQDFDVREEMVGLGGNDAKEVIKDWNTNSGLAYAHLYPLSFNHQLEKYKSYFDVFLFTAELDAPPFALNDSYMSGIINSPIVYKDGGNDVDWSQTKMSQHFPISNKHCISFVSKSNDQDMGTDKVIFTKQPISKADVQVVNQCTLRTMKNYAFCSDSRILKEYCLEDPNLFFKLSKHSKTKPNQIAL